MVSLAVVCTQVAEFVRAARAMPAQWALGAAAHAYIGRTKARGGGRDPAFGGTGLAWALPRLPRLLADRGRRVAGGG